MLPSTSVGIVFCVLCLSSFSAAAEPLHYPATRRVDQIDTYFGVPVADPIDGSRRTCGSRLKWPPGWPRRIS